MAAGGVDKPPHLSGATEVGTTTFEAWGFDFSIIRNMHRTPHQPFGSQERESVSSSGFL
jgi:hypothetical protein